ncbi:MAG: hypothetical protein B6245_23590 [Desulfobacteraceae bacterium 4572_88]|nr:MAG: hypothetical protein B6245_23590 [Desulfobacteraceae bacterium 4572_88]
MFLQESYPSTANKFSPPLAEKPPITLSPLYERVEIVVHTLQPPPFFQRGTEGDFPGNVTQNPPGPLYERGRDWPASPFFSKGD